MAAAAKLKSQGCSNKEIADILGCATSHANNLICWARKEGLLEDTPVFRWDRLTRVEQAEVDTLVRPLDLLEALKLLSARHGVTAVGQMWAFASTGPGIATGEWTARRRHFGCNAARVVAALVQRSRKVALAWGESLSMLVQGIRELSPPVPRLETLTFLPLRGDPINGGDARTSSSVLAAGLAEVFGASAASLAGTPAVVPRALRTRRAAIRAYAEHAPDFRRIFPAGRLDPAIDCVLTSVGVPKLAAEPGYGTWSQRFHQTWGCDALWLARRTYGDIAGVFVPKPGLDSAAAHELAEAARDWIGPTLADFRECAARCATAGGPAGDEPAGSRGDGISMPPGMVLIATGGPLRAQLILRCCELGLVNTLVVDHELRSEMLALLQPEPPTTLL